MIYLFLSILASSLLYVIFKLFDVYKVNTVQAIVMNYIVAGSCGLIGYSGRISISKIPEYDWFYGAIGLGVLFIIVFNLMAVTTQKSGLSVVSVASKMSVIAPIIFGILYYNEGTSVLKILGILLALSAVYFSSIKSKDGISIKAKNLVFPVLVFLGSGIIDTSIKFLENEYVAQDDVPLFSSVLFFMAFITGLFVLGFQAVKGTLKITFKKIIAGVALGVPNYFSIYYLIQALRGNGLESSTVFTINNVAIVMFSTILGIVIFKEKLITKNWLGVALAIISIILVASTI